MSVLAIEPRSTGLVSILLQLKDGSRSRVVIARANVNTGDVQLTAQAIAQIALVQRGIL